MELPRVIAAAGVFNLDDVGADIREERRAERPGQHARKVDNADAGKQTVLGFGRLRRRFRHPV